MNSKLQNPFNKPSPFYGSNVTSNSYNSFQMDSFSKPATSFQRTNNHISNVSINSSSSFVNSFMDRHQPTGTNRHFDNNINNLLANNPFTRKSLLYQPAYQHKTNYQELSLAPITEINSIHSTPYYNYDIPEKDTQLNNSSHHSYIHRLGLEEENEWDRRNKNNQYKLQEQIISPLNSRGPVPIDTDPYGIDSYHSNAYAPENNYKQDYKYDKYEDYQPKFGGESSLVRPYGDKQQWDRKDPHQELKFSQSGNRQLDTRYDREPEDNDFYEPRKNPYIDEQPIMQTLLSSYKGNKYTPPSQQYEETFNNEEQFKKSSSRPRGGPSHDVLSPPQMLHLKGEMFSRVELTQP